MWVYVCVYELFYGRKRAYMCIKTKMILAVSLISWLLKRGRESPREHEKKGSHTYSRTGICASGEDS